MASAVAAPSARPEKDQKVSQLVKIRAHESGPGSSQTNHVRVDNGKALHRQLKHE